MEEGENMSFEELNKLEEEKVEFGKEISEVNECVCKDCDEKLVKIVENRSLLDGTITFHIIKLKCMKCGKEYLDLDQAEKYDFLFTLEKAIKSQQALKVLARKISE